MTQHSPQAKGSVVSGTSHTNFTGQHSSGTVQSALVAQDVEPPAGTVDGTPPFIGDHPHNTGISSKTFKVVFSRSY